MSRARRILSQPLLCWAALLLGLGLALPALAAGPVALEVGETRSLTAPWPVAAIEVDAAGVVEVGARSTRQIELTGAGAGQTGLRLVGGGGRSAAYDVTVRPQGAARAQALEAELRARPGLERVAVEAAGGERYVLTGPVGDLAVHRRLQALAPASDGAVDLTEVAGGQMVAVDVRFVAVSDTTLKALGFNFSRLGQGFQWALLAPNTLNAFEAGPEGMNVEAATPLQNAFNLLLHNRDQGVLGVISALSDAGLSEILAQPTLLVRSGEQAEFLAGGEVPVPVPQSGGNSGAITIDYRPYGVRLAVEPYVLSSDRIALKIAPEVSELDYANRVALQGFSIPGIRRRSASTTVELGDGQSFVIAGLTYASSSTNEAKVPVLGDLPILGTFFKMAQGSREKLELIIVATPRLVAPLSAAELAELPGAAPPPRFTDLILGEPVEQRAARFGLSR